MNARILKGLVLVAVAGLLAGCDTLQALNLQKPTASLKGVKFDKISLEGATLIFDVDVDNPYSAALPLTNLDYGLTSGTKPLFSGKAAVAGSIPAKSSKTLSLPAQIRYLDLIDAFKGIKPGSSIPYKAQLGLFMDTPVTQSLRLPITKEGQLTVPTVSDLESVDWQKKILDTLKK
jgi:LEA14-like dessication related protein